MADYFDCVVFKETQSGKKFARTIGSAKKRDDGGFNVYLDANPLDGKFCIMPQRDRNSRGGNRSREPGDDDAGF